ncbi:hypothetical protein ES703_43622 [subsurface metagenome]
MPKRFLLTRGKATGTGVAGRKRRKKKANIYSVYNLSTLAIEEIVATITSVYDLSTEETPP